MSAAVSGELADGSAPAADLAVPVAADGKGAGPEAAGDGSAGDGEGADPAVAGGAPRPLVALVDTGAPEGAEGVEAAWSAVGGEGPWDANGHGTAMLGAVRSEDPSARVVSAKALGADGRGTAATVYAAVVRAAGEGAEILNLSFAGYAAESNAAIAEAVSYAQSRGCGVVAAAGNAGADASLFTPAGLEGVFTAGAAADDGSRLPSSNWGEAVDAYVTAQSTSYAAARATGWASAHWSPSWRAETLESGIVAPRAGADAEGADGNGENLVASVAAAVTGALARPDAGGGEGGVQAAAGALVSADMSSGWTDHANRWTRSYDASTGVNTLSCVGASCIYEHLYATVAVAANTDYALTYRYKVNTAYQYQNPNDQFFGFEVTTAKPAGQYTYLADVVARDRWSTEATDGYEYRCLLFNSGGNTTLYVNVPGCNLKDGVTYKEFAQVKDLDLSAPSSGVLFKSGPAAIGWQPYSAASAQLTAYSELDHSGVPQPSCGWRLEGWAEAAGTQAVKYADGATATGLSASSAKTLYAVYRRDVSFTGAASAAAEGMSRLSAAAQYCYNTSAAERGVTAVAAPALEASSAYGWAPLGYSADASSPSAGHGAGAQVSPGEAEGADLYAVYGREVAYAYDGHGATSGTAEGVATAAGTQAFNAGSPGAALSSPTAALAANPFARTGYSFVGWRPEGLDVPPYEAGSTIAYPYTAWASGPVATMEATWGWAADAYAYSASAQAVSLSPGTYLLEAWGATGGGITTYGPPSAYGDGNVSTTGKAATTAGAGGYTRGIVTFGETTTVYVYTGQRGAAGSTDYTPYNGGSRSAAWGSNGTNVYHGGGGMTHISLAQNPATGSTTSSAGSWDQYGTLVCAGGGGSADDGNGGYGGYSGGGFTAHGVYGATTQTAGNAKGVGQSVSASDSGGGGGGWMGGLRGGNSGGGAGGTGHLGDQDRLYVGDSASGAPLAEGDAAYDALEDGTVVTGVTAGASGDGPYSYEVTGSSYKYGTAGYVDTPAAKSSFRYDGYARITRLLVADPWEWAGDTAGTSAAYSPGDGQAVLRAVGAVQEVSLPAGTYLLEAWGASGGNAVEGSWSGAGGAGGYSAGTVTLTSPSTTLYVGVGSKGADDVNTQTPKVRPGGFNGGGAGQNNGGSTSIAGGGGATHFAVEGGELSSLSQSQSSVVLVAGGGGGGGGYSNSGGGYGNGGAGGGKAGGTGTHTHSRSADAAGGGQEAGTKTFFGRGAKYDENVSWDISDGAGGGGGWYGGQAGRGFGGGAGGGSGRVGGASCEFGSDGVNAAGTFELGQETVEVKGLTALPTDEGYVDKPSSGSKEGYARITRLSVTVTFLNADCESEGEAREVSPGASTAAPGAYDYPDGWAEGTFLGWAESKAATSPDYVPRGVDAGSATYQVTPAQNMTLYPIYSRAVSYSVNGGGSVSPGAAATPQLYHGGEARAVKLPAGPSGRNGTVSHVVTLPQVAGPGNGGVAGGLVRAW